MIYIGVDPGKSGGMAALDYQGKIVDVVAFKKMTMMDVFNKLVVLCNGGDVYAMIEKVHSMPKQGVASSFSFGEHYGGLQGLLTGSKIPYGYVTPQRWMKRLECRTGGDKNVTKSRAQQQWPEQKITHAIADALLIAEYCRLSQGIFS